MDRRPELQVQLESITNTTHVYFQPPESFRLNYPCLVYRRSDVDLEYADNLAYRVHHKYELTWLHMDPDDDTVERLLTSLPLISYVRQFALNGVYHDVMYLYK